ncbi:MAG: hypothetical protein PHY29_00855 [Syntrophales bacterium]|nr:hypothetical protein [Syntrophales bacterium]
MTLSKRLRSVDADQAVEELHSLGCTDGLPVIIPTPERVERMVLASGLDPDIVIGELGPNMGVATVEKIAVNAVMAGCETDVFPVVVAALKALCNPILDITEVQSTTHNLTPLLIVNGPIRRDCRIAGGTGALGPGHRANATIGRAVRLCMINIGGGRPGISDMALLGHPGKFTYCLAEDEEASPFPPLHTSLGFSPEESTVTVVCAEAPHSMVWISNAGGPEHLLKTCAKALSNMASNNAHFAEISGVSAQVLVLNPDHAAVLASAGYGRREIQQILHETAGNTWRSLVEVVGGGAEDPDRFIHAVPSPDSLLVLVAGGPGVYSSFMPSWCFGKHGNVAVTEKIETGQSCEIPYATLE